MTTITRSRMSIDRVTAARETTKYSGLSRRERRVIFVFELQEHFTRVLQVLSRLVLQVPFRSVLQVLFTPYFKCSSD
jgi:hypothetical protein